MSFPASYILQNYRHILNLTLERMAKPVQYKGVVTKKSLNLWTNWISSDH